MAAAKGTTLVPQVPKNDLAINYQAGNRKIENSLEAIGMWFMLFGVIGAVAGAIGLFGLIGSGHQSSEETNIEMWVAVSGFAALFQGIVIRTIFYAIAEIIRLLRQVASK